jgi:ABC-2 type transport system permease protein
VLRNIFLKTLRDNRWGILAVGLGLGLVLLVTITSYPALFTGSAAERARQSAEFMQLLKAFSALLGEPVPIDTLGGFLTFRSLGFLPVVIGVWAAIVAAGLIRGEEEQGALDVLLTTPHGRSAVFGQKVAALGLGLVVVLVLMGVCMLAGAASVNATLPFDGTVATLANMGLITAFWAGVALLISQVVASRRTASTITGGLLFVTFVLDNMLTGIDSLKGLAWALPFHYYSINKPLVPGRVLEYGAWAALAVGTVVLLGAALWMFARRDVGAVFPLLPARRTANRGGSLALLGSTFGKTLRDLIGPTLGWGLALGALAALLVAVANEAVAPMRDVVRNIAWLGALFGNLATTEGYLSSYMDVILPLILAFFAVIQVANWTGDEESGRMELLVSEPLPRLRILLARYAAVVCSLVGILVLQGVALIATAALTNTPLDAGRVVGFLFGIGVVVLVVLAFGLAVATWLKQPGLAVPITGGLLIVMYFIELLGGFLNWPEAVRDLSIFHLYGRPLVEGLAWGNMAVLLVVALLLAGGSLAGFARRDIAK